MVTFFTGMQPLEIGEATTGNLDARIKQFDAVDVVDRVLVGYSSIWPHNHATIPYMLGRSQRLSPILAHRPGVMHPTAAARQFATLDVLAQKRLALNIVVGGSDKDLMREGDATPKDERYERAVEYVELMKATWAAEESFDHQGHFYSAESVHPLIKPLRSHIPIFMGGESDAAVDFGAKHADLYMLWGEPVAGTKERVDRVRAIAAEKYGRSDVEFSLSLRLFVSDSEDEAWERARAVESEIHAARGTTRFLRSSDTDRSVGRQRALALVDEEIHDICFWTGLTKLLGGFANSQSLVGTPDQIRESLSAYQKVGVNTFLVTTGSEAGWDDSLIPLLTELKAQLA